MVVLKVSSPVWCHAQLRVVADAVLRRDERQELRLEEPREDIAHLGQ